MKMVQTWKHEGVEYIAIPNLGAIGNSVLIANQDGEWFGAWMDIESFKKYQEKGEANALKGKVQLAFKVIQ